MSQDLLGPLETLIPMIPLVLLLTESRHSAASKKCKKLKKPKRINSPRDEVGSNRKPGTRKGPGLLADLKIALRGRGLKLHWHGRKRRGIKIDRVKASQGRQYNGDGQYRARADRCQSDR
jgi:hypothetical protein